MKKLIALFLCLIMVLSLAATAVAVPKPTETNKPYKHYVALGDSIAAGNSLPGYKGYKVGATKANLLFDIPDAYPTLLKTAVGADAQETINATHAGMRLHELAILLNKAERDDFTDNWFSVGWGGAGAMDNLLAKQDIILGALKKADLVTLQFGANDLIGNLTYALYQFDSVLMTDLMSGSAGTKDAKTVSKAVEAMKETEDPEEKTVLFLDLLSKLNDVKKYAKLIADLAELMASAVEDFMTNWDAVMSYFYDEGGLQKEDVKVVVLGTYNPIQKFGEVVLGSKQAGGLLSIVFDPLFESLNYKMQYGSKYASRYVYLDITDLPDILDPDDWSAEDGVHPGVQGHMYLKNLIVDALNNEVCKHKHTELRYAKEATLMFPGYTGDLFCSDCGQLLEQGDILSPVTLHIDKIELPRGIFYEMKDYTMDKLEMVASGEATELVDNITNSNIGTILSHTLIGRFNIRMADTLVRLNDLFW